MKLVRLLLMAPMILSWAITTVGAATIVTPNSLATVEGSGNNTFPFAALSASETIRYQQVIDASEFGTLSGPHSITAISMRRDEIQSSSSFSYSIPSIQINLSTTSASPDGLSTIFASNLGLDDTQVFNGPLSLALGASSTVPRDFDADIILQSPFVYDPSEGNLLLDVRNFSTNIVQYPYDAQSTLSDSISRVVTSDVNGLTGTADTGGLVFQFTVVPVSNTSISIPEPSTLTLALIGFLVLPKQRRVRVKQSGVRLASQLRLECP